jgi:outer membrane protein assembly factor BamB
MVWSDARINATDNAQEITRPAAEAVGLDIQFTNSDSGIIVDKIGDYRNNATLQWKIWTWNSTQPVWTLSNKPAEQIVVGDVTAIAWVFGISPAPSPSATPEHRYPWTSVRHDDLNTGRQPDLSPNNLTLAWEVDLTSGGARTPVTWQGLTAVMTDGPMTNFGWGTARNPRLYVLNETGSTIWQKDLNGPSPLFYDGKLIVSSTDVQAFNASSGELVWTLPVRNTYRGDPSTSPVVFDDKIVVVTSVGWVISINLNGTEAWSVRIPFSSTSSTYLSPPWFVSPPAVRNGTIFVASMDGTVSALSADGSRIQWSAQAGGYSYQGANFNRSQIRGAPLLMQNEMVVTYNDLNVDTHKTAGGVAGISYDGHVLWRTMVDATMASPVLTGKGIAVATNSGMAMVNADGVLLWNVSLGVVPDPALLLDPFAWAVPWAAPASANGSVFLVTPENESRLIAMSDDGEVYFEEVLDPISSTVCSPSISDGMLYVTSDNGFLYVYNLNQVAPYASGYGAETTGSLAKFQVPRVDGTLFHYSWDFGDGSTGTGSTVNHTYLRSGNFTVELTVSSPDGQSQMYHLSANNITVSAAPGDDVLLIEVAIAAVIVGAVTAAVLIARRKGERG